MTAVARRGACPTLAAPMLTGDGWLARLTPVAGLRPKQLAGLAAAAARLGNGLIEITGRGSLQIRGLTEDSASELAADITRLGILPHIGPLVETGALAGLDADEVADPRPIAEQIRRRMGTLTARLAPKTVVVVDGGGALHLDGVGADVRLRAVGSGWLVSVGDRARSMCDAGGAVRLTVDILEQLAALGPSARARDLAGETAPDLTPPLRRAAVPIGGFTLRDGSRARGFGLPFGQTNSDTVIAFAGAAEAARDLRPAAGRALIAVGLTSVAETALLRTANDLGLIVEAGDPRLAVVACSGAPACRSANLGTRALAERLVASGFRPPPAARLHLSGCAKRCAQPLGPTITLVATPRGCEVTAEGTRVPDGLGAWLMRQVSDMGAVS